ncbi:hypothetical protein FDECE_5291 [Fusarium decemcellulare]|nr:hypothetical protein FDECE_5291 [Fusarium decemcellulare]
MLLVLTALTQAAPSDNERPHQERAVGGIVKLPEELLADDVAEGDVLSTSSTTDYRTMPVGTYTETITDGLVRIIIVSRPTTTAAPKDDCPKECDCSDIKDKGSEEEPGITKTSSSPTPTPTCPDYCDCAKVKDKESDE